ncbi:ABC transporter permease [Oricola thermophila]|uniref:ABC transporter permease n=1 Tax=Oricola thermophila TaxID=2742145 RepID=A0A6N1VJV3_9HYPH|nr:ABC transporter permease [Oricola thermophila]QKV20713.1 ABC transporter permease [Oricola thermophila]
MSPARAIPLAFRFALRELRGGLSGFYVFLACIALGTAAIGGVNAVSQSITQGIDEQGQVILGGDLRFELNHRTASAGERAFLDSLGEVAVSASMRSMARLEDQSDQSLVELKAVDERYPLYGTLETEPALDHEILFGRRDGRHGAAVQQILLDRLGLAIGDTILLGNADFEIRALILSEPDAASDGFAFAPRVLTSLDGLEAAGLVQPGSLVEYHYKIRITDATEEELQAMAERAREEHPAAGWSIRNRANAAPALSSNIERFAQFLTLVGLTALVTGGVGVANAVRAFLESKRNVIATFKCLGAPGGFVTLVYLIQILAIAAVGIVIGLVLASFMPWLAAWGLAGVVPLPASRGFFPGALALATIFALVTTLAFAILPLGRARDIPATDLFRDQSFDGEHRPRPAYLLAAIVLIALLAVLAVGTSFSRDLATLFLGGIAFSFGVLRIVSLAVQAVARRAPRVRSTPLRLAIGNIHRPGALTQSVVLSLGLGLTLLVALALIDGNLRQQISGNLPEHAPNFFFVDIQNDVIEDFSDLVTADAGTEGQLVRVPMLRGRIVELNGQDVATMELPPEGGWVLRGDRGVTYSADVPENSTLVEGEWWPEDYDGEPLVSFSAEEAGEIGLGIGDTITVNVLGRNITARIANLRQVQWESLAINFVMVFSPNTFAGAPHAWLATLTVPGADSATEADILRAVTRAFPTVTSVRVKDAIDLVNRLIGQLATAIRAAAAIALVASVLVLGGALAAGNRARVHDAVVLKMLGATRRTLITAFTLEYLMLGAATALFALLAGGVAAWFVVARIMNLPWQLLPGVAAGTLITALVLTVGFGLAGTWRILGQKAAPVLRNL